MPADACDPTALRDRRAPFAALLALVFAIGAFSAPAFGARSAIVPDVIGEEERLIGKATAVFQAANRLTILLGPVAGGVLIGVVGATRVLYIDAATYLVSIALVGRSCRERRRTRPTRRGWTTSSPARSSSGASGCSAPGRSGCW